MSIDTTNGLSGISCASTSLCVAVNYSLGDAVITTDPTAASPTWRAPASIDAMNQPVGVSCPSASLCVAVDAEGNVVISTDPTAASPTWSSPANIDGADIFAGVSCASVFLCAAADAEGNTVISTDPTVPKPTWSVPRHIDSKSILGGVACAAPSPCVAVDNAGFAVVGHLVPVTRGQIKASLAHQITPHGAAAALASVLKQRGYGLRFSALSAGRLVVDWYYVPKGGHPAKGQAGTVVVAVGTATFPAAEALKISIKLTGSGERLLRHRTPLKLTAQGTFTPTAEHGVVATENFTLRR